MGMPQNRAERCEDKEKHILLQEIEAQFLGRKTSILATSNERYYFFIWFVRLLALRPLLAYCASLG
jgi:hypothetical protein